MNNPFYYPMGYQPAYPQQNQQNQQNNNNSIIWVQGEAGAKSFLMAPNSQVQLWDSERQTIYLKSTDAMGMPSIRTLDYTIRESASQNVTERSQQTSYVTAEQFHSLEQKVAKIAEDLRREGTLNE